MLTLRSSLLIDALDADALGAAEATAADAVLIDLASPAAAEARADARRAANRALLAIAATGRPVHVRVSDTRSGETEGDIMSVVRAGLSAVVLAGSERPQDARELDVAIRKQEMRRNIEPGTVRLIAEVDSAAGLRALPGILDSIDRHSAVSLHAPAFAARLGVRGPLAGATALLEHAMAEIAVTTSAAGIAWMLAVPGVDAATRAALANRAHALGAAGVVVASEAEAQGFNRLFAPDEAAVAAARAVVAEWEALRARDAEVGVAAGQVVDRRTMRLARGVITRADAVAARERVR
ncbi:MAG: aldolase/citrate lyase family protein [Dehalococcoidia bacterium]